MDPSAPGPVAVLFDNDGLLLDTESARTRAERVVLARRGVELTPADKLRLVGKPAHELGLALADLTGTGESVPDLLAEVEVALLEEIDAGVEPMPGARELVAELRECGMPVALVSNSKAEVIRRTVERVGMGEAFEVVVSGHDVGAPKPEPDAYLEACRRLGIRPSPEVVVLEDSPTGVAAGLAAGLTVIGVPSIAGVDLGDAHHRTTSLGHPELRPLLGLPPLAGANYT